MGHNPTLFMVWFPAARKRSIRGDASRQLAVPRRRRATINGSRGHEIPKPKARDNPIWGKRSAHKTMLVVGESLGNKPQAGHLRPLAVPKHDGRLKWTGNFVGGE